MRRVAQLTGQSRNAPGAWFPNRSTLVLLFLALGVSLALNVLQYFSRPEEKEEVGIDYGKGVRVVSGGGSELLVDSMPLSIHEIVRRFCEDIISPRIVVFPGLNLEPGRPARSYHSIRWRHAGAGTSHGLPDAFDLVLNPGDEVRVENAYPPLDDDYMYQHSDFTGNKRGNIAGGIYGVRPLEVGWEVCEEYRKWPSDSSSCGKCVVRVSESERLQVLEYLEQLRSVSPTPRNPLEVSRIELAEPLVWYEWTWPVGSASYRIANGEYSGVVCVSAESDLVFSSYAHDD
jgi:hypothetical protein